MRDKIKTVKNRISLTFLIISVKVSQCYAANIFETSGERDVNNNLAKFGEGISKIYDLARKILLPIAALSIAASFFSAYFGGSKQFETAKNRTVKIVIAVALFYLIPLLIKTGMGIIGNSAWRVPSIHGNAWESFIHGEMH